MRAEMSKIMSRRQTQGGEGAGQPAHSNAGRAKRKFLNEIVWVRAIACLAVVAIHAVNWHSTQFANAYYPVADHVGYLFLVFTFGTPLFIMISEVLAARTNPYADRPGFLRNRFKYLLTPYLSMLVVYAVVNSALDINGRSFVEELIVNIFGLFNPYFVLIILQFAILHQWFAKRLAHADPKRMLVLAFVLNALYLLPFNVLDPPSSHIAVSYLWQTYYFYVFPAWIFYFVAGYYIGRNYECVMQFLARRHVSVVLLPVVALGLMMYFEHAEIVNDPNSKRVDNIVYAMLAAGVITLVAQRFQTVPWMIDVVSRHSFGIYLLHMPVLFVLGTFEYSSAFASGLVAIPFAFAVSLVCSLVLTALVNRIPYGFYVVGRLTPSARAR